MIDKAQMMALLFTAYRSFQPSTPRSARNWEDEDEEVIEAVVQEFSDHILELLVAEQTDDFGAIFATIERLHLEGNAFVRENAATHLVDSLLWEQNVDTQSREAIRSHLGPESLGAWKARSAAFDGLPE